MKRILLIILIVGTILLTGCGFKDHSYNFPSGNNADCIIECKELMKINNCFSAIPSYTSIYLNNNKTKGECSCFTGDCLK